MTLRAKRSQLKEQAVLFRTPSSSTTAELDEKPGAVGSSPDTTADEKLGASVSSTPESEMPSRSTAAEVKQEASSSAPRAKKKSKQRGKQQQAQQQAPSSDKSSATSSPKESQRLAAVADTSATAERSTPPTPAACQPVGVPAASADEQSVEKKATNLGSSLPAKGHTARETQGNGGPRPPKRPGYGTVGRPIKLRANFFRLNISSELTDLYHYDVEITPNKCPRAVKRDVVNEIIRKYKDTTFQGHQPAFDGEKNLYSRIKLPPAELSVKLPGEDGGKDRDFKVKIQFAAPVSLLELKNFLSGRQNVKVPQDAVQALDIVMRQMPSLYYTPVGRSFFPFDGRGRPLGEGCEVQFGFYSSLRHSEWKAMLLNIDVSAKGFTKSQPVIPDFVCEILEIRVPQCLQDPRFSLDKRKVEKAIRGIRIETTHAASFKRKYTVWGVSNQSAERLQFDVDDETSGRKIKTTVAKYFKDRYNLPLRYPHLPCLQVGQNKDRYLPMEVCTIIPCHKRHLSEQQTANMIRSTARPAPERQQDIEYWAQEMVQTSSKYLREEFKTSVSTEMVKVGGRVLPAPTLNLGPQDQALVPRDGSWDMRNKSLHQGARIETWALACFARRCNGDELRNFCKQMASVSSREGMRMTEQPTVVGYPRDSREKAFDLIDHHILINKLHNYDLPEATLFWIIDFLTDRKQRVKLGSDCFSEWESIPAGVPQGTKLVPWMFIIMINELDIPDNKLWKYVDDTTISETVAKNRPSTIQTAVDTFVTRAAEDKFQLNEAKCKELRITFRTANNSFDPNNNIFLPQL
ncbi:hypothetical protein ACROYT_G031432 [Oculina patagonica]